MRRLVRDEQVGKCARCKKPVHESSVLEGVRTAMQMSLTTSGLSRWEVTRDNLQVLCGRCNRQKTARDMGKIARWKKYHGRGLALQEEDFRQILLF